MPVEGGSLDEMGRRVPAPDRGMSLSLKLLRRAGLWSTKKTRFASPWTVLTSTSIPAFLLMVASYFFSGSTTPHSSMENLRLLLTFTPVAFNAVLVLAKRPQLESIISSWRSFTERSGCSRAEDRAVSNERKVALLLACQLTVGFYSKLFEPLIVYSLVYRDTNGTARIKPPLEMYPVGDRNNDLVIFVTYASQLLLCSVVLVTMISVENFSFALILHATNQFELLVALIRSVDSGTEVTDESPSYESLTETGDSRPQNCDDVDISPEHYGYIYNTPSQLNTRSTLTRKNEEIAHIWRNLAAYHQEILRNTHDLCELLRPLFFLHYALTSLIICLALYESLVTDEVFQRFHVFWYCIGVVIRLFIMNYLPTRLTTKSLEVGEVLSTTQWHEYNQDAKTSLVIFMCRAQRPVHIWAGRFAVLSLETYAATMQAAYTYFNILRKMA